VGATSSEGFLDTPHYSGYWQMGDVVLANVTSLCGGEKATTDTNWTTECAAGRRRGDIEVSAIDYVTWTLVIADLGHC